MNISKYISDLIKSQGREKKWVAEQIGVNYRTFLYRLDKDTLLAKDILFLSKLLDIDLNKLKGDIYMIRCNGCNVVFDKDDLYQIEEKYFCDCCVGEHVFKCIHCEKAVNKSNKVEFDGKLYCIDCFNELFFVCELCGERYSNREIDPTHDKTVRCLDCYNRLKQKEINMNS